MGKGKARFPLREGLHSSFSIAILALLLTIWGSVQGAQLTLPLADPLMPWADRLAALPGGKILQRPYYLQSLQKAAEAQAQDYPWLSQHIQRELKTRYGNNLLSLGSLTIQAADGDQTSALVLPNSGAASLDTRLKLQAMGQWSTFSWIKGMWQGSLVLDDEMQANTQGEQAHLAIGSDFLQVTAGLQDMWSSYATLNAPLLAHNAANTPSIRIHNPQAWSSWGIHVDLSLTQLAEQPVYLGNTATLGNPLVALTQLSFHPLGNWGLSLKRSFMFGGGAREVDAADFVQAFFSPTIKDNVGIGSCTGASPNCEFGNQQMSVESVLKLDLAQMPVEWITTLAAEDTERGDWSVLGNTLMSFALHLPYLTQQQSLKMQWSEWETAWYTHHIYPQGYTSDGVVLGSYWGQMQGPYRGNAGQELAVAWQIFGLRDLWQLEARHVQTSVMLGGKLTAKSATSWQLGYRDQGDSDWDWYVQLASLAQADGAHVWVLSQGVNF